MGKKLAPICLDSYQPLREVVCESLREAIRTGVLKPGERLMEIQLAEELGVSRTPVREAIRKLDQEGYVVMMPRRGAYVADMSEAAAAGAPMRIAIVSEAAGVVGARTGPVAWTLSLWGL